MKEITRLRYKNYDWESPFDPTEYLNPKAITLLYENWLRTTAELEELQEQIKKLEKQNAELDKFSAVLLAENKDFKSRKWLPFVLQLVALIGSGIGINLVTSQDGSQYGWGFIGISVIIELIAFVVMKSEK